MASALGVVIVALVACEAPPSNLAPFTVNADLARSEVAQGRLLLTQLDAAGSVSYAAVVDGEGEHQWWWSTGDPAFRIIRARPSADGTITVGVRSTDNRDLEGFLARIDAETGKELSRVRWLDHHHEHVELPDGRIAFLSRDRLPDAWLGTSFPVSVDVVRVLDEDDGTSSEMVDLIDDLELEPFWSCSHMGPKSTFVTGTLDWSHANSLVYEPETDSLTLGIRHFDAVVRVGLDGVPQWWLGDPVGVAAGFGSPSTVAVPGRLSPADGANPPRHGHFSEAWADGLLVFDNGGHVPGAVTRVVEYAVDLRARTYREVWSYEDPYGRLFNARGDAIRLPGGNRLVVWSGIGQMWEVTPDGDIVWEAQTSQKILRALWLP